MMQGQSRQLDLVNKNLILAGSAWRYLATAFGTLLRHPGELPQVPVSSGA